jgi:hypothetical protein
MANDQNDELDEIQDRVDEIRDRLPDNPGTAFVDKDDVPAYFNDGNLEEGEVVTQEEAAERDDPHDHQAHAPG